MEGGRVVLGGIGSECDGGALYEMSKQIVKILGWGERILLYCINTCTIHSCESI